MPSVKSPSVPVWWLFVIVVMSFRYMHYITVNETPEKTDGPGILTLALLKALPAMLCCKCRDLGSYGHYLCVAFICCLMGDIFLCFEDVFGGNYFMAGLLSFFAGHVLLLQAFKNAGGSSYPVGIGILLLVILGAVLTPIEQKLYAEGDMVLVVGVAAYGAVIALMSWKAFALFFDTHGKIFWPVVGSVIFMASDMILAWNKFIVPVENASMLIMGTYYAALICLCYSTNEVQKYALLNELATSSSGDAGSPNIDFTGSVNTKSKTS